ncbi:MAG: hypothetical protein V1256_11240, partial [Candidatus Neomarinimicrobiota bacterium]|nr:hypothetical protein [Candidatus Neomarinimicrobiota bacterium]
MIKILRLEVLFIGLGICLLMDGILGQNLVRSKAPSLYLVECQVIATGKVDGYLSNRWDHSWQAEKGFGGSDLKTTDWGDIRLRKNRLKFYPALEGTGSA